MGVSVEDQRATFRISDLVRCGAKLKFLSVEPLICPIRRLPLRRINWVIVGGGSGPRARPMKKAMEKGRVSSAKNNVEALLRKLPDDCTLEDIQYHLYVLEKIQRGLEVADTQGTLTQEEVEQRLSKWITR
jgi:Protein of unknown function (DUF5131)